MNARFKGASRHVRLFAIAAACAMVVGFCAFCLPAWAQDDLGAQEGAAQNDAVAQDDATQDGATQDAAVAQDGASEQDDSSDQDGASEQDGASVQGDAAKRGTVVQYDSSAQEAQSDEGDDSASSSSDKGAGAQVGSTSAEGQGDSSDTPSPEPLDAQDNVINEGQVSDTSFLYDAAIADLAGADAYYDGQTVQVTGEAVGEAISPLVDMGKDSGMVRVTLYEASSGTSVTVVMSKEDADKIGTYGAYGRTGATLRVQGTFHLTCQDHEGESDIHADIVTVLSQGSVHPDEFVPEKFIPGVTVMVIGLICLLVGWRIKERSR